MKIESSPCLVLQEVLLIDTLRAFGMGFNHKYSSCNAKLKYLLYVPVPSVIYCLIVNKKVCVIIDESPDVLGRPAVNTLVSFCDNSKSEAKKVVDFTMH